MLSIISALTYYLIFSAQSVTAAEPLRVVVTGIEGEILANVRAALSIPPGTVRDGKVNMLWLELFKRRAPQIVQEALEPFGYYNARVSAELETISENSYVLKVNIEPGPPVIVKEVEVTIRGPGEKEKRLKDLANAFPLKKGGVLREDNYENAKGALKALAVELGYLDADFPVHSILVSRSESNGRIQLALDTGPRYFFGEVRFEGAGDYPESFLRRYIAFKRGEVFSYAKLSKTQLNLMNSDRFKDIVVSSEKEKAPDFAVPVLIHLEPSSSKRLRFGLGYGTDTGARFTLQYKDLNIFHRGHEFDAELDVAQRLQGLAATYTIPGRDIDMSTGIVLKLTREDVTTYMSNLISLELNRTRSFGQGIIGMAYLRFQQEHSSIGIETVNARLILPGIRLTQQKYDSLIRPKKGYRYGLEILGTDRSLGSSVGLLQIIAEGHILVPLPWRLSALARVTGGTTFVRENFNSLPASLRFFAGGDRSVRGYGYQTLGPKDTAGNVVGGKSLLVGSIELERAILQDWGVAVFYDVGNALNSLSDFTLFQGAGVGVRYYTKVGAIRIDIAHQIGVPHPGFHIHFNFGAQL